ncbi:MAG TPA: hypothetical protein VGM78_10950, partial [Ilumatobacteraceae bacterium]
APPSIAKPYDWPFAVVRTLTRPLPIEAHSAFQLLAAAEMTALLVLCVIAAKRLRGLPRLLISNPFVAFVCTTLFIAGLAYSSFANLGVLTRQKSLILPLMLLLPCLPIPVKRNRVEEIDAELVELTTPRALAASR